MSDYEIDLDGAINEFGGDITNDGGAAPAATTETQTPAQTQAQQEAEYEYTARGQKIKEPISKILGRASQGYDYAYNTNQLKEQREAFEREREQFQSQFSSYQELVNYANDNPEWWQHVQQTYNQSIGGQQGQQLENNDQIQLVEQLLEKKIAPINNFIQGKIAEEKRLAAEKADHALKQEIEDMKKTYNFYDFSSIDESGRSLERRVLEHAKEIGTTSFKVAFKDLYHEDLMNRARNEGIEKAIQEQQKKSKLGLLGKQAPSAQDRIDHRNLSYDQLLDLAMNDENIFKT